jgi:8-oxo-dGTP pyrophosphatase MutT (NUDIX family)
MEEVACGCIPWRIGSNKKIEILVILRTGGYWEFPKGKKEENETDIETAKRELKEETGLEGEVDPEKCVHYEYLYTRNNVFLRAMFQQRPV